MIKIYYADISSFEPESCSVPMSEYRIKKLKNLKPELSRKQSAAAELLLNAAVKDNFPETALPLNIKTDENGKPFCPELPLNFNLSHSENMLLCALADGMIGADIQYISHPRENLLKRQFTEDEQLTVREAFEPDRAFTEIWARKESCLKALGVGIRLPMKSFSVLPGDRTLIKGQRLKMYSGSLGYYCYCVSSGEEFSGVPELKEIKL